MFRQKCIPVLAVLVCSCAGTNPNPGERTADVLWSKYRHEESLKISRPAAERGEPWAQLRLGIAYELGLGVPKDIPKALYWYKLTSVHKGSDKWSEGLLIGAIGQAGYFNQNSDAMVAEYQIANIYLNGDGVEKDLVAAFLWIKYLEKESAGKSVFICCEFEGGRWIPQKEIQRTIDDIEKEIDPEQRKKAEQLLVTWKPSLE